MTLQSMTGFARSAGAFGASAFAWELRSVNGKTLEIRTRLPTGFDRLEPAARQMLQRRFQRGSIQATLTLARETPPQPPAIDEGFLRDVAGLAQRLAEQFGAAPATAGELLALPGVLALPSPREGDEDRKALDDAMLAALDTAADALAAAREAEGEALGRLLAAQVDGIAALAGRAEADPSRDIAVIRQRLADQVGALLDASPALDEQRLHSEAAFLATKADIREEIDRLKTHVASARSLLSRGGAVGRRLDFLAQEFNRESNTLCAKSGAAALTAIGLELKAVVDQFREQIQNLE